MYNAQKLILLLLSPLSPNYGSVCVLVVALFDLWVGTCVSYCIVGLAELMYILFCRTIRLCVKHVSYSFSPNPPFFLFWNNVCVSVCESYFNLILLVNFFYKLYVYERWWELFLGESACWNCVDNSTKFTILLLYCKIKCKWTCCIIQ